MSIRSWGQAQVGKESLSDLVFSGSDSVFRRCRADVTGRASYSALSVAGAGRSGWRAAGRSRRVRCGVWLPDADGCTSVWAAKVNIKTIRN